MRAFNITVRAILLILAVLNAVILTVSAIATGSCIGMIVTYVFAIALVYGVFQKEGKK